MLPDRVSNPGPLTYESGALPIALRGPAVPIKHCGQSKNNKEKSKKKRIWALERGHRLLVTFQLLVISNRRMKMNKFSY